MSGIESAPTVLIFDRSRKGEFGSLTEMGAQEALWTPRVFSDRSLLYEELRTVPLDAFIANIPNRDSNFIGSGIEALVEEVGELEIPRLLFTVHKRQKLLGNGEKPSIHAHDKVIVGSRPERSMKLASITRRWLVGVKLDYPYQYEEAS